MTVYAACRGQFEDFVNGIIKRAEMDAAAVVAFKKLEALGIKEKYIYKSIDYAMSKANLSILELYKAFKDCECPIIAEERGGKVGRV